MNDTEQKRQDILKAQKEELFALLNRPARLRDEEFLELCYRVRGEYMIRFAIGAVTGSVDKMGAYSDYIDRAQKAIESHYRIIETRARTRALNETTREYISVNKATRKENRERMLELVS